MALEGKDYLGCKRNYTDFTLTLINQRFDYKHCVLSMDALQVSSILILIKTYIWESLI